MEYRIGKEDLLNKIAIWDGFSKKKIHLIACGGTAMTLLGIKNSTKDIDFMVPDLEEYNYLINILKQIGYKPVTSYDWAKDDVFIFELFSGNKIHTTELLESPLKKENHILITEFSYVYLGVLNYYDLIISKLFRAAAVDIEDCLHLIKAERDYIDIERLKSRFKNTASFDISEDKVNKNLEYFLKILKKEGLSYEK